MYVMYVPLVYVCIRMLPLKWKTVFTMEVSLT